VFLPTVDDLGGFDSRADGFVGHRDELYVVDVGGGLPERAHLPLADGTPGRKQREIGYSSLFGNNLGPGRATGRVEPLQFDRVDAVRVAATVALEVLEVERARLVGRTGADDPQRAESSEQFPSFHLTTAL
jgi:hypothetical protein